MPLFTKEDTSILFVHVPKCGGTAIENAFRNGGWDISYLNEPKKSGYDEMPCNPQHYHNELIEQRIIPNEEITRTFTVIRNPYTRLISEMLWMSGWNEHVKVWGFDQNFFKGLDNFGITRIKQYKANELQYQLDKQGFLKRNQRFAFDNHMRPQHHYIGDDWHIYWYEELYDKVWKTLESVYDIENPGLTNSTISQNIERPTRYSGHSEEFKDLFTEIYYDDCKMFGYELPF
jgi:hypothetical protein